MIRKVNENEISKLYPFVYKIFSDMELPVLDKIEGALFKEIITDAMHSPHYRYGYEHAWVCERDNQIAGVFFGYPGEWEPLIDGPLQASMLKHGLPIDTVASENETLPSEWYLDTLVTAPNFRRQGVAREMIERACGVAKEAGFDRIALNCDVNNEAAFKLYQKSGFENKTQIVLSNHVYWHMGKEL